MIITCYIIIRIHINFCKLLLHSKSLKKRVIHGNLNFQTTAFDNIDHNRKKKLLYAAFLIKVNAEILS